MTILFIENMFILSEDETAAFFAVFDGHGGSALAQHVSKTLPKKIFQHECYSRLTRFCSNSSLAVMIFIIEHENLEHKSKLYNCTTPMFVSL